MARYVSSSTEKMCAFPLPLLSVCSVVSDCFLLLPDEVVKIDVKAERDTDAETGEGREDMAGEDRFEFRTRVGDLSLVGEMGGLAMLDSMEEVGDGSRLSIERCRP